MTQAKLVRGTAIALLVGLMVATGFVRDWMSVNINFHLSYLYYGSETNHASPLVQQAAEGFEYMQVWYFKWILTVATAIVYGAMTAAIGVLAFKAKSFIRLTAISFGAIFMVSGIFYVGGYVFGDVNEGYLLARALMDFVQSPMVLMVLVPAFYLSRSNMLSAKNTQ